ncbi:sialate O-acetylesterase [Spirosoma sp. KUDC1026]|uniref:sialate O-acetylesterase n=1 Tax=Spirosoma sp. KUDC1026 TaxID=2745947 RepID=UPI00159B9D72|nr:sialate O-acetylesterase [Spirosoma sp. KUDC1026]QKZ13636.1 T9SS type A sorting domain-containing protein [Spirosoma sp. KUDC1026]
MHRLYWTLILFMTHVWALGQVSFTQLPQDLQLYPRNASNQANVGISGTVTATGYNKVNVQVRREGILVQTLSQSLSTAASLTFQLTATIKAEPAEYSFHVFLFKGTDSTLIATRQRVVCGDVYLIHGQSNALAQAGIDQYYGVGFDDKYLRNCTYVFNTDPRTTMRWYAAKDPYSSVGGFGLTLQRLILQTYGIPTLMLNGAIGGTGMLALSARDPSNHANLSTYYGMLLYRAQWAGVANQVKAIIWKQGENEAGSGPEGYDTKFDVFYRQLREDYGDTFRLYVGQLDLMKNGEPGAAALRDFQRRTKYLYKNVETIATVGTRGYDGIHYDALGHQQMAYEQFRQIARDFYGATDTLQINSPEPKKVFYNTRRDSVTLAFDEAMQMVWRDTAYYSFATGQLMGQRFLKDMFYLDKQAGWVTGAQVKQNRVVLSLKEPAGAKTIRYMPPYFADSQSSFYNGPTLKNSRDMRAFTFDSVAIADAIPAVTTLAARPLTDRQIQLVWQSPAGAMVQVLERADGTGDFRQITSLNSMAASYVDNALPDLMNTYSYRIKAVSAVSESAYSNVVSAKLLVLATEPTASLVRLYPNPLGADQVLRIEGDQQTFIGLNVYDLLGREVKSWRGKAANQLSLPMMGVTTGLYIADIQTAEGQLVRQKLLVR